MPSLPSCTGNFLANEDGRPEHRRAQLEALRPPAAQLVALDEGRVVGWLYGDKAADVDLPGRTYEVIGCYTHPEYWRCGVAKTLMQHLLGQLTQQWRRVVLWTPRDLPKTRAFYEAMGFVVDGAEKEYERGGEVTLVRYAKQLGEENK